MAVLGRLLISSAERLDLPDLLSIDSYSAGDWKYFLKGIVGPDTPYILKGFDVIDPQNAIGTQSCSIRIADSAVFYPSSSAGSFYYGLPEGDTNAQPLVPELRKNATNYVYITFSTFNTSTDSRAFWDPDKDGGAGGEFTQDVNTESVLQAQVGVSTGSFPTNTVPVAIVTVGPVVITSIEDARDSMFRLGSGGIAPNPFNRYAFRSLPSSPYEREEPSSIMVSPSDPNPFQGGDKNIYSLKEWMDVVMTKLLELGGTTYWYEDTSSYSLISLFNDALATTFKSKGQWMHDSATAGLITWTEDAIIQGVNTPKDVILRAGNVTLADNDVAFLSLVRNQPLNSVDLPVSWTNGQPYVNTVGGAIGLFGNLAKGDWVRKNSDTVNKQLRVEEFYDAVNLGGSPTTAALAKSIRLNGNYQGTTANEKGRYDKGVYQSSDVDVVNRNDQSLITAAGNMHWLAMRSDVIENISALSSVSLTGTLSNADGTSAKITSTAHGLVANDKVTITAPAAQAGTYTVEVEDANTFYINTTNTSTGAFTGFYGLATTAARDNGYGLTLESANHNFQPNDTIIFSGTTNYNGARQINVRSATQIQFGLGSAPSSESTGQATLARVNVRAEEGLVKIVQGENIYIGDVETDNIRKWLGMGSASEAHPFYLLPANYGTINGFTNYNCLETDNVVSRLSKLTAMMADKSQDRNIQYLPLDVDSVDNNTSGPNQVIDFNSFSGGTPTLYLVTPGSDGNVTMSLTGTLSLGPNQVAYFTADRNNATSISDLTGFTVVDMDTMPLNENIFILAYRLNTTDVWIWDGHRIPLGGAVLAGGSGTGTLATYYDPISTTLQTGVPVTVDGSVIVNNDTVLFSNLSSNNNRIYRATVVSGNVTAWSPVPAFTMGLSPSPSETVRFKGGTSFHQQLAVFDGASWSINDTVRYFNGTDYWEVSSLHTTLLNDNTTDNVFTVNFANSENIIVDYSLLRGTVKETGTIHITTDGINAVATTTGAYIGSSGVAFTADISGPQIRLRYTTTSTGSSATMKYYIRRWSNAAGGPGGPPNYSGGGGGGGSAAGSPGDIQFNSSGVLAGNSNFKIDTSLGIFNLNGLEIRVLDPSAVMLDNQPSLVSLFSYSASTYRYAIVEYSVERNGNFRVGRLLITNDGTSAVKSDDYVEQGVTGVSFDVTISGGNVVVQYTTTNTGFDPTFKYSVRRWG